MYIVVVAIELLDLGEAGVGVLNSAIGVGALVGGVLALSLTGAQRLSPAFMLGVVLWGAPLIVLGIWPEVGIALILLAILGIEVACRYGGDEFTIVLPEASLADVWRRAEQFREAIKKLDVQYEGKRLGPVTLSIGGAASPDHGLTSERVLLAADAASYAAKSAGGDRIMVGRDAENA